MVIIVSAFCYKSVNFTVPYIATGQIKNKSTNHNIQTHGLNKAIKIPTAKNMIETTADNITHIEPINAKNVFILILLRYS